MLWNRTLFFSRAKSVRVVATTQALLITAVVTTFPPLSFPLSFGDTARGTTVFILTATAIASLVYWLIRRWYGVKVSVFCEKQIEGYQPDKTYFHWRGNSKHQGGTIPCSSILSIETCHYPAPWWKFPKLPFTGEYVVQYRQFGYEGPGVVVRYKLPPMYEYKPVERTVVLPVAEPEVLRQTVAVMLV